MKIIGREQKIDIIDFDIKLQAKVDTGAYRNSIHVDSVKEVGNLLVVKIGNSEYTFENYDITEVKNSSGNSQVRYIIDLNFKIGHTHYISSFSIANRSRMKFPCLLGRMFLARNRFLVDVRRRSS